ncbi:diguanylate cyclase [Aeromicrobium yanjiei]|uniref:Diguanylate cyclase n=1 Tax=Aeromicrobium yanjiei TaxID=2662028 RepID=A0A5Q2MF79_9ACTN|nr:diguanylate cyclase [Aeromicrobium yanjiei]
MDMGVGEHEISRHVTNVPDNRLRAATVQRHNCGVDDRDPTGALLFSASAQRIVDYLNAHTPIPDWSVSRVAGGEQVHVHVHPETFLSVGQREPWPETFCVRMLDGASRFVPDSSVNPDYADHPLAQQVRAYAGMPLTDDLGQTFGTLCGVGPDPLTDVSEIDVELIELMADLLSSQLAMARTLDRQRRAAEIAEALAHTDALTGLTNRRGWDLLVQDAQQRIDAYGDLAAVAVIDLDGLKTVNDSAGHDAGDELICAAAAALSRTAGEADRLARYGGDEFVVLSNSVAVADLDAHFERFRSCLAEAGIAASIGHASTTPGLVTVMDAFALADANMYASKPARRTA